MTDFSAAKAKLEAQLAELEGRQAHIERDLDEPAERAVEREDDDALEGQAALVTREISSVKRAISRIEDGEYGVCVRCGGDIAPARLDARPEAALCIACASKEG
jgi:RNA polymerase-binding transcription factor DksA